MKILLVSTGYPPHIGGAQTQARFVAQELSRRHDVDLAAVAFSASTSVPSRLFSLRDALVHAFGLASRGGQNESGGARAYRQLREFCREFEMYLWFRSYPDHRDEAVMVHSLAVGHLARLPMILKAAAQARTADAGSRREVFLRGFLDNLYRPRLRALMRGKDIVHCLADGHLGWIAEEVAREQRVPFVITPYVHPGHHGEDDRHVAFYRRADIVFALLETGRDGLIELGVAPERLRLSGVVPLLPSTVDAAGFRRRTGLGDRPMVLFLGRIMEYKGVGAMLAATAHVWEAVPNASFFFAGPSDTDAHEVFSRFGDGRVRYLGLLTEQEKGDALASCDVFCMPSVAEILPAVYLEAWTYGKPVVGGTAHGLRELIEGNGGGVVVSQDPREVGQALVTLLSDPALRTRLGESGRRLVERRFTAPALVASLESAYREVVSRGLAATGAM